MKTDLSNFTFINQLWPENRPYLQHTTQWAAKHGGKREATTDTHLFEQLLELLTLVGEID